MELLEVKLITLLIDDVEVINTGHYGIGLQDLTVTNAKLTNLTFATIGGDCIDIKSNTTVNVPAFLKKVLLLIMSLLKMVVVTIMVIMLESSVY